jgi:prolyl oligopeptidase
MNRPASALALTFTLALLALSNATAQMTTPNTPPTDPYLWLEEVQGEKALAWVRQRNAESEKLLQADPRFAETRDRVRAALDSKDQIPAISRRGEHVYNLWRDAANPRGLWRRTTLAEYRKAQPAWETVLDIDALGKAEGSNWVWAGARCLGPSYRRCLISLSRGGADAAVVREFDTVDKKFVDGGFVLPEARSQVEWIDENTLFVGTDFGPGSLTESGLPRVAKRWKRGTPLASAATVFEGQAKDVAAGASYDPTPGFERTTYLRYLDFYNTRQWLVVDGKPVAIDKPDDATLTFWRDRVLLRLRSDWAVAGKTWPRGSLLVADAAAYLKGSRDFTALFTPTATRSLTDFDVSRSQVLLTVSDNVASRIEEWKPAADGPRWTKRDVAAPFPGTLTVSPLHDPMVPNDPLAEHYLLSVVDFLNPDSLQLGRVGSDERERLKARPSFWNADGMRVEQRFAKSKDGTRVPYFVIWPKGAKADGDNPTLLYGYGGFEISMQPFYSPAQGIAWTTRGGVFVLANIRGGGEFGPAWHQAALKADRQKSFDDFIAVAEDLVASKVTQPQRLGIMGGSNGGLLVGAVMLQRPELFNAVVCQVPLLDMQRFNKLLVGQIWEAEFGNPDKPEDWAYISRYSPYQNVKRDGRYPKVLFTTSTRDDRVHPGHARKMAARMAEYGHPLLYWENTEGGHGGAADNAQRAKMVTLEYAFLWRQLGVNR